MKAEKKLNEMLKIKLHITKMESDRNIHRRKWKKHAKKVRKLGQQIGQCKKKIMEMI